MAEEVRRWLEEAAIGQYADQFIAEGYECLTLVEEMDDKDVQELAEVMKMPRGHAKKLRNEIPRLQEQRAAQRVLQEGNGPTAAIEDYSLVTTLLREQEDEQGAAEAARTPTPQLETLRLAVQVEDYSLVATLLREELGFESKIEMLPLIRGVLADIVREEDEQAVALKERRRKAGTAFGNFAEFVHGGYGDERPAGHPAQDAVAYGRRWQKTVRWMFNAEAAIALQTELLVQYSSLDFQLEAEALNNSWTVENNFAERMASIDGLCLRCVLSAVMPRYGFAADINGQKELKASIDEMSKHSPQLLEKQQSVFKVLMPHFPNLQDAALNELKARRKKKNDEQK